LSRDPQDHLSREELAWLAGEVESALQSGDTGSDRKTVEAHAAGCNECGSRLRAHRSVQAGLRSLATPVSSKRTSDCPAEEKWLNLAVGRLPAAESSPLLEHASSCDYCGQLLREASEDLDSELLVEDKQFVATLSSAGVEWQRNLAQRLEKAAGARAGKNRGDAHKAVGAFLIANRMRWVAAIAAVVSIAVGIGVWQRWRTSVTATDILIAQAYTEQRPFVLRFPDARYGPVRQQRGYDISSSYEPQSLKDAKVQIAKHVSQTPKSAQWLQAKARVDMLEGHYQSAIAALQQAQAAQSADASILVDLATAYFELSGDNASDNAERALGFLDKVLSGNPRDPVALFNRASIYQTLQRTSEARADFDRYLEIDPSGEWALEARHCLDQLGKDSNHN
jgi:tetratricopeptide (TPR) repeat protein